MGSRPCILVADHDMLKMIMVKDFANFQNGRVRWCAELFECHMFATFFI